MEKLRIIIGGFLGILPAGGVTWDYVQYPLGFSKMGHDVFYIEDTRLYPVYQKSGSKWGDPLLCVRHLQEVMGYFGLDERWAYRDEVTGKCFGLSEEKIKEICSTADVFVNISCSTFLRDEYLRIPARVLIDTDPMFTQIQYISEQTFTPGQPGLRQMIEGHNFFFTFGENIHSKSCRIPDCGIKWTTTRQPVCLDYWKSCSSKKAFGSFTTVMNWAAGKRLQYNGEEWGQKDIEFQKILTLPQQFRKANFSIAINQSVGCNQNFCTSILEKNGWKVLEPDVHVGNWAAYQRFINKSIGEFSIAKATYVKGQTGWFSCRSACYLAAGKPVVTQDTGWSKYIPAGKGLFSFDNIDSALAALETLCSNYERHAAYAREMAEGYFDSEKVLTQLLSKINF